MTTSPNNAHIIDSLVRAVARLRNEQTQLITASSTLLAHGIASQNTDVHNRLRAIRQEAANIGHQLDLLGETDLAEEAVTGWAILPARPGRSS